MTPLPVWRTASITMLVAVLLPSFALAQTSKSAAVAKELATVMDGKKLDAIAAKVAPDSDRYVAALYFPGVQLLVIAGKYPAPVLLDPKITQKQYRDVYMELSGTVAKESKVFVMDMGVPGLTQKKADGLFDTWTQGDKQVIFDGNWDGQKISEADYNKTFSAADDEYTKMLSALLAEAKK
jgi:hypothetical protein